MTQCEWSLRESKSIYRYSEESQAVEGSKQLSGLGHLGNLLDNGDTVYMGV